MFFSNSRGLRLKDLLLPFLFILITEVLFNMNDRLTLGGKMSGFIVKPGGGGNVEALNISHLLFADDAIISMELNWKMLKP